MKQKADDELKNRYGLPETLGLMEEDEVSRREAKAEWDRGVKELELRKQSKRQRLALEVNSIPVTFSSSRLESKSSTSASKQMGGSCSLRTRILENTARRSTSQSQLRSASRATGAVVPK